MGIFSKFRKTWYDIMALSPQRLIHFKGNRDTGFTHILERNGFYSGKNYFGPHPSRHLFDKYTGETARYEVLKEKLTSR